MARVNHRRVKELLKQARSKITDRQFFSSRMLAGHFEDIAVAQTRRHNFLRQVHVNLSWEPKSTDLASTNNTIININCGNKLVTKIRGRTERYQIVLGLFSHELGHVLFTDFLSSQSYINYLSSYQWYPSAPALVLTSDIDNEKALWDYVKADPVNLEVFKSVAFDIANILEDAYIECCMVNRFPGVLGTSVKALRRILLEDMPTVTEMIEKEDSGESHIFCSILQNLLSYATTGEIKYGEEPLSDERIQAIFKMIPEIDSAITTTYHKERWKTVSFILVRLWSYLEPYLDICKKNYEEAAASGGTCSASDIAAAMAAGIVGTTTAGTGSGIPVTGAHMIPNPASNAGAREKTKALATSAGVEESGSEELNKEADASNESGSEDESKTESGASESSSCDAPSGLEAPGATPPKKQVKSEEGGRIPYHHTDSVSAPVGGCVQYDHDYAPEPYGNAASDIERLLERMATKDAQKQAESELLQELNDVAQNISYGDAHSGINVVVHRIKEVDDDLIQQYNAICPPLLEVSRHLQRSLKQKLQDHQQGGKQTGLMFGRRLDAHALCRNDGKVFYKNNLPNQIPRISVGLLLDESGSMSFGQRSTYARSSAIIIHDFCRSLHIPVMVYGHSTSRGRGVDLYSYSEFESIDNMDMYRLMDISARNSNRDGAALRYVAEQLVKRPEEIRLLMLVSDGQPAASGYSGSAAEEDLRGIHQEYRRKGILFVAAAIGDDRPNIQRIYGDAYLDITDLTQLPVKLTNVIKQFLR